MGSDAGEYFAEGTQAWFQASARADVNEGMLTRAQLRSCDPDLAVCLAAAFGEPPAGELPYNFTAEIPEIATRRLWMRRQTTYLLMRFCLSRNPDAFADILEKVVGTAR